MIDLSKLLELPHAEVMGTVINNKDPEKQSRLQVKIPGFNDNVPDDQQYWIEKATAGINNTLDIPLIDDVVYIIATNGQLRWRYLDFFNKEAMDQFIGDDDYLKSVVLTYKNLDQFKSEGHLFVGWADSTGYRVIKDQARFEMRKDNSILMHDGKKCIHINEERISLGSENTSKEPAVMGDQNHTALKMLNNTIKSLANLTQNMFNQQAEKALTSPYTAHLAPNFRAYGANFKSRADQMCADNEAHFPKTLSEIVSLD